jgi:uncharacterized protein
VVRIRGIVIGGVMAALLAMPSGVSGQLVGQETERTIRVAGSGEFQAQPDEASIRVGVETFAPTAREAGEENARLMDALIRALTEAGVARNDLRTSGYALHPEYTPQREPGMTEPRIRGYRAVNQLSVRTRDLTRVGALIDVALGAGANRMHGVEFGLRDSSAAEAEALARAVARARASAETIAAALGVRLGAVLDASTTATPVQPFFRDERAMGMDVAALQMAPTPIEPGEQTVRAMVSLVFAIE